MLSFPSLMIISYIIILLAMAFFTLFEQKILGYSQLRKGPNKVSLWGVPQPLADALKLFTKEITWPLLSNKVLFMLSPFFTLLLAILLWSLMPSPFPMFSMKYGLLFFLCVSSLSVYTILAAGWASNSKYSLLGALRSIAQTVSYEVSMSIILLSPLMMLKSFNTEELFSFQYNILIFCPVIFILWFTTTLAETNRSPFDLAEGESELVSGFNTEYSGGLFTIIFMAEYLNILMMSLLSTLLFLNNFHILELNLLFLSFKTMFMAYMFIWARATLPRMRYDFLMNFTWKGILPFSLIFLMIPLIISL
uniref:NADH-ubiquinone oxidoreductase chain 1 n=1 Tax=Myrianida brachycephala TaxID=884646 RepID=A0A1C9UZC4_MYRBC|nr:NADH dehydrogenase subunit 1 [Myrianida brachycephala]AOR87123.1 NADH dehydrogenase subunit 1 [Myrianida brachycephala]